MDFEPSDEMLGLAQELVTGGDVNKILTLAIDHAIESTGADRGMIILLTGNEDFLCIVDRNRQKQNFDNPEHFVFRKLIDQARKKRKPVYLAGAIKAPIQGARDDSTGVNALLAICVPLNHADNIFGVVYFEITTGTTKPGPEIYEYLQQFTDFLSPAAYQVFQQRQEPSNTQIPETELRKKHDFEAIIGHHPKILEILAIIAQIAPTDATVLVQGESGTGKELVARALHKNSHRKTNRFIPVNCAGLPDQLLESELFGHIRGAFTGAIESKTGWFEYANGGTLFLDEVNDMSPALQLGLLRILQSGEYSRLGSTEIRHCDVRIVAAASRNLQKLVQERKFREEVYHRLNVIDIWMPPLRDRKSDIPVLVDHFLQKYGCQHKKPGIVLSKEAESLLTAFDYPGNVRELENIINRAVVFTTGNTIEPQHLPKIVNVSAKTGIEKETILTFRSAKQQAIEKFEREYIRDILQQAKGNISQAAKAAGIHFPNLYKKIKKYGIEVSFFKY